MQNFVGLTFGVLWFDILRIRRSVIMSNLEIAFPNKPKAEKIKIGRASCVNLGMTYVEFIRMHFISKKNINEFQYFGKENLEKAEAQGKGVFILTLHMGNGDYASAGFALLGKPIVLISKVFKIKWVNEAWFSVRRKLGNQYLEAKNSSLKILRHLKNKQRVIFVMDQFVHPPMGIKTLFFGKSTRSSSGLAVLAYRTKAPVIPMFTYRNKDGITEIHCLPEIPLQEKATKEETILWMTQLYQDQLEEIIKNYPDQWMWVHRRWKDF